MFKYTMYKLELVTTDTHTRAGTPHSYYLGRVLYRSNKKGYNFIESKSYNKNIFSHKRALEEFMIWAEKRGYLTEDLTTKSKMKHTPDYTLEHPPI